MPCNLKVKARFEPIFKHPEAAYFELANLKQMFG